MISRKSLLASGIAAAVLAVSSVGAATIQSSNRLHTPVQPHFPPHTNSVVLFSQLDDPYKYVFLAQNFENTYDAYDSEAADDFVVPAGGWTLSEIDLGTLGISGPGGNSPGFTGATTATINIYPDASGEPGNDPVCSFPSTNATVNDGNERTIIKLPDGGCSIGAGTYWLAAQIDLNYLPDGNGIFWISRSVQSNSLAVWRNLGNAIIPSCPKWKTLADCGGDSDAKDLIFQIVGTTGGGAPPVQASTAVPAMSRWGAALGTAGVALLALFGLRRRLSRR